MKNEQTTTYFYTYIHIFSIRPRTIVNLNPQFSNKLTISLLYTKLHGYYNLSYFEKMVHL